MVLDSVFDFGAAAGAAVDALSLWPLVLRGIRIFNLEKDFLLLLLHSNSIHLEFDSIGALSNSCVLSIALIDCEGELNYLMVTNNCKKISKQGVVAGSV